MDGVTAEGTRGYNQCMAWNPDAFSLWTGPAGTVQFIDRPDVCPSAKAAPRMSGSIHPGQFAMPQLDDVVQQMRLTAVRHRR